MNDCTLSIDNYYEISTHIKRGKDWKSWILVCKDFAKNEY
jgi:hypothetical protein